MTAAVASGVAGPLLRLKDGDPKRLTGRVVHRLAREVAASDIGHAQPQEQDDRQGEGQLDERLRAAVPVHTPGSGWQCELTAWVSALPAATIATELLQNGRRDWRHVSVGGGRGEHWVKMLSCG